MTSPLRVSVAMATYNGERYILQQLESLALQIRPPDELVVSDDCSTDHTVEIMQAFARCSPFPVRILRQERNCGYNVNFDRAIAACAGELIFLCDQDDMWLPEKIACMYDAFVRHPSAGLVVTNSELVDEQLRPLGWNLYAHKLPRRERVYPWGAEAMRIVLAAGLISGHTMAFRRMPALCAPTAEASDNWGHDVVRVLVAGSLSDVVVLPRALTKHRRHRAQVTQNEGLPPTRLERVRKGLAGQSGWMERQLEFAEKLLKVRSLLRSLEASSDSVRFLEGAASFGVFRTGLSPSRILRISPILRSLLSGSYHTYANGFSTAARDALAPSPRPRAVCARQRDGGARARRRVVNPAD